MNILGTEYTVKMIPWKDRELFDAGCEGDCDFSVKLIRILDYSTKPIQKSDPEYDTDFSKERILRHEIIHAFLWESGMFEMAYDEELVNWLAIQFPKIEEAINKWKKQQSKC